MKKVFSLVILASVLLLAQIATTGSALALSPNPDYIEIIKVTPESGAKNADINTKVSVEFKINSDINSVDKERSYLLVNGKKEKFEIEPVNYDPNTFLLVSYLPQGPRETVDVAVKIYTTSGSNNSKKWSFEKIGAFTTCYTNGKEIPCWKADELSLTDYALSFLCCCCLPGLLVVMVIILITILIKRRKEVI